MSRIKKFNNQGFVLVETLVVSVFVMAIFSIIYINFYPLMGEYEKREVYDDVDGKYAAYWMKRLIQNDSFVLTSTIQTAINNQKFYQFNCNNISDNSKKTLCNTLIQNFNIETDSSGPHIYLTTYNTEQFKAVVKANSANKFSGGFQDYIVSLPKFTTDSLNYAGYRIIIEFHRTKDDNDYLAYSTIEVKK